MNNKLNLFILLCLTLFNLSCDKNNNVNDKLIITSNRSVNDDVSFTKNTSSNNISIKVTNNPIVTITPLGNNNFSVTGMPGIQKITFNNNSVVTLKNFSILDNNFNNRIIYFDEDDTPSEERPCCSRSTFKSWYRYFRDNCENNPECDVICNIVPCNISHYVAAVVACCTYGGSLPPNQDPHAEVAVFSINYNVIN